MNRSETEHLEIVVETDNDPFDPREDDNVGVMICAHRRYDLGDEQYQRAVPPEELKERFGDESIILPLYLYDHGGLAMRTGSFSAEDPGGWDSGLVGFIVCPEDAIAKEFRGDREKAEKCLRSEVETYHQFLSGQVYGFTITEKAGGEIVDSCWGLFGLEYAEQEANETAEYHEARFQQAERALAFALAL